MSKSSITRRTFIAGTAVAGALAGPALKTLASTRFGGYPDLAAANGANAANNTRIAIEAIGGMGQFVSEGQIVNILPNAQGAHPGSSTNPDIVKAVAEMCKEAGAKEVRWLTWLPERVWERTRLKANQEGSGTVIVMASPDNEDDWKALDVPHGMVLKQIKVMKALFECDVFINMPIVKDHAGSRFTGSLKNYMGTSFPGDNRTFHPTFEGEDVVHMEKCIADLNTVVLPPDLIVMDAMEILTTNGPFGPGEIAKPQKVVVGTDRVAIDSFGATLLGLTGPEVTMIQKAHEHGLGEIDLNKLEIKEIQVS